MAFVVAAVLLMAGTYLYMRAKMPPAGRDGPRGGGPAAQRRRPASAGPADRGWVYRTDAAGRPRRFLSHREAAWWAVQRVSAFFYPFLAFSILWTLFGSSHGWWTALPVVAAVACVWLAVVGAVYLYLALSGGVMGRAERRRRGGEAP